MKHGNHILRRVDALAPGDLVDLQGDKYADRDRDRITFEYELAEVYEVVKETATCCVVEFSSYTGGFPPDHRVKVHARK